MTNKLKIGKVIDNGILSSVNECTLNGKKYVIKYEHVTKKEQNTKTMRTNFFIISIFLKCK